MWQGGKNAQLGVLTLSRKAAKKSEVEKKKSNFLITYAQYGTCQPSKQSMLSGTYELKRNQISAITRVNP